MTVDAEKVAAAGGAPPAGADAEGMIRTPRAGEAWRSIVFAPRGDGTTRRRGSDVIRLAAGAWVAVGCWLIVHADAHLESSIATFLSPPPNGVNWLVTVIWVVGSLGVIAFLFITSLLSRRREVIRDVVLSGAIAWGLCVVLHLLFGAQAGLTANASVSAFDTSFPLARVAATYGVVAAALPYLSRLLQRSVKLLILLLAVAAVVHGSGLPFSVLASLAIGFGVAAAVHLGFGSPLGLPSSDEVAVLLANLGVEDALLEPSSRQVWGVARFRGTDDRGPLDVSVYGRDAVDAQFMSKFYRFVVYRDSGPTLTLTRVQQVEHEAYLTLMAGRGGARVPEVLAAGPTGPARDAVLVTRPPAGRRLADLEDDDPALSDPALDDLMAQVLVLRRSNIAHGSISAETIVVGAHGRAGFTDFRGSTFEPSTERSDSDVAAVLAALALKVGADRTVAAASRVLPSDVLASALPRLQGAALDPALARTLRGHKGLMADVRERGAAATGVEVPKLAVMRRISGMNLVLVVGSLIGGYALIGVLLNVTKSLSTIADAHWGWVAVAFVLAQLAYPSLAFMTTGSTLTPLVYGRVLALEVANAFVALAIPMGPLAMRVRFFQKQGSDATAAVSSAAVASTVSWIVKGALFLISIPLARGTLDLAEEGGSSGHANLIWLICIIVVVGAVAVGVALLVPRLRRMIRAKIAPSLSQAWNQVRLLMTQPRKLVEMIGGAFMAQVFVIVCTGASLHAYGEHLPLATIIVILTTASIVGGVSPVPGGMGVVEAGMIIGFAAAGLPQADAVAVTFIQRLVTAYLPPIWGWGTLVWIRRKEYI
ncbi:MAG: lysylphosphatidylglycerol synthase domain-containing protein [Acidimicrobiales bacterium]